MLCIIKMSVAQANLRPTHNEKNLGAMKAKRAVKRITFDRIEASPGATLYVSVPKLNVNDVLVPGSLALLFNIDLAGGHANNFLVQNVTCALVDRLVVKYAEEILQDIVGYDIFKIWEELFLSQEERDNMILEGIQSEDLCKICSGAGYKKTSGADAENKLNKVYGTKYRIRLDHQILTEHGVFYPQALYNDLVFELTLAQASQVVKGSDPTNLKYKLINIELEYEMVRSRTLADEALNAYSTGKEFLYDHVQRPEMVSFPKGLGTRFNIKVNPQRRSLKGILLLFVEPYAPGARDSEKVLQP